jgi:glycerophosphoryl diester phosphodiesterase
MITLGELCEITAGRTPLLIEVKSDFPGDCRLLERCIAVISGYRGAAALMSFDAMLVAALRARAPGLTRGIVAEKNKSTAGLPSATMAAARRYRELLRAQPQFIAFAADDLPAPTPAIGRYVFGRPVLAWTVRTPVQEHAARRYADQIIFEHFRP